MIKKIRVSFANGDPITNKYICYFNDAILYARKNLARVHNVYLDGEILNNYLYLYLQIPDEIADDFNTAMHMGGFSRYLVKNYRDIYEPKRIGTRIFVYKEEDGEWK